MDLNLKEILRQYGYESRAVAINRLEEMRDDIEQSRRRGQISSLFYKERLKSFIFHPPSGFSKATNIIVAAFPQSQILIRFHWKRDALSVLLPPTYIYSPNERLLKYLSNLLGPEGYRVAKTILPIKLLAVRSGLGAYGRNNLCYVGKMGSFCRLMAFYTDAPIPSDEWSKPVLMDECRSCSACARACPTGAITFDRFLLRAEQCLTFLNERPDPFPPGLASAWHHCLFGCMRCQNVCPRNWEFTHKLEDSKFCFSDKETKMILASVPFGRIPASTQKKLKGFCLAGDYSLLSRNLTVLLDKEPRKIKKRAELPGDQNKNRIKDIAGLEIIE